MELQGAAVNPVDASGRITLREHHLAKLKGQLVLTQGFDRNILLFTKSQWESFAGPLLVDGEELDPDLDDLRRLLIAPAVDVTADDRGRLKIPEALREWAEVKSGGSRAVVLDIGTRFEIWEEARYKRYLESRAEDLKQIARRRSGGQRSEET